MKYGIEQDNKFLILDDDKQRVMNTIMFIPSLSGKGITEYSDDEVEFGSDNCWYLKGYAPKKSLDELKSEKLQELKNAFQNTRDFAHCECELGFEIDANETAYINVMGCINTMTEEENTLFRAYDNSFHEVTKAELETIKKTIELNAKNLYALKWQLEARINAAETEEELAGCVWEY